MKKGFFGGGKDDSDNQADTRTDAEKAAAREAVTDRDGTESGQVQHRSIIADARNVETDDGSVNPHNEAMAQKPVAVPLDRDARAQEAAQGDWKSKLREWKRRHQLGGPTSGGWEELDVILGDRQDPAERLRAPSAIPEGARSAAEDAGATPSVDTTSADATRSKSSRT